MSEKWSDVSDTPALIYDESILRRNLRAAQKIASDASARLLFSIKACYLRPIVEIISGYVDGFSCSSPYELRFVNEVRRDGQLIHLTSPALTRVEIHESQQIATHISFNSLNQWQLHSTLFSPAVSYGLRVNPRQSFVTDARYDPCRPYSHLGVSFEELQATFAHDRSLFRELRGIHFHTNCDAPDFRQLATALATVVDGVAPLMSQLEWVNVGGGYFVTDTIGEAVFAESARHLAEATGLTLIFEPGAALVDDSGSLVTTVLDIVQSEGKTVAIIDSSVNHLADVLDFNFQPKISTGVGGAHEVIVAGRSCLAGDVFGTYRFEQPLVPGMRLTFTEVGGYSLAKATMFNGLNLPSVNLVSMTGELRELARYDYRDFRRLAGDP